MFSHLFLSLAKDHPVRTGLVFGQDLPGYVMFIRILNNYLLVLVLCTNILVVIVF